MSFEPLKRTSRVATATATARGPIPQPLIGLAVTIMGWIVLAMALRMVDSEMLSVGGLVTGFCLVIGGLCMMLWAER